MSESGWSTAKKEMFERRVNTLQSHYREYFLKEIRKQRAFKDMPDAMQKEIVDSITKGFQLGFKFEVRLPNHTIPQEQEHPADEEIDVITVVLKIPTRKALAIAVAKPKGMLLSPDTDADDIFELYFKDRIHDRFLESVKQYILDHVTNAKEKMQERTSEVKTERLELV